MSGNPPSGYNHIASTPASDASTTLAASTDAASYATEKWTVARCQAPTACRIAAGSMARNPLVEQPRSRKAGNDGRCSGQVPAVPT